MMVELITASDTVKHVNLLSSASGLDSREVMSGTSSSSITFFRTSSFPLSRYALVTRS